MRRFSPLLVLAAATLWGSNGLFVAPLSAAGLSSVQMTTARFVFGLALAAMMCAVRHVDLRLRGWIDMVWMAVNGIVGVFLFGLAYTIAIQLTGMATAAVLIYLMPSLVMAWSVARGRERLTIRRVCCLAMSLVGCALVSGVGSGAADFSLLGVLVGLAAAVCYAIDNVVQAGPLVRYDPLCVITWSLLFGSAAAVLYAGITGELVKGFAVLLDSPSVVMLSMGYGALCTLMPLTLYNMALRRLPVSVASLLATFEPVAAAIMGTVLLSQPLTPLMVAGIAFEVVSLVGIRLQSSSTRGERSACAPQI